MPPAEPQNIVYGMRANGTVLAPGYTTAAEAEAAAKKLLGQVYVTIEIVERATGRLIMWLRP